MLRLRIVARLEPRAVRSWRFLIGSAVGHVVFALLWVVMPGLGSRARPSDAQLFPIVDLVAAPPGLGSAEPAAPTPPEPETVPEAAEPEGVRAEPRPVKPEPERPAQPKPPPKPKQQPKAESKKEPKKDPPKVAPPPEPAPKIPGSDAGAGGAPGATSGEAGASVSALQGLGDVELGWYKGQLSAALYRAWQKPLLDGVREPREVHVTFVIQRDGSVRDIVVVRESGVPTLDRSALRAVYKAAPLPPLPPNWRDPTLPVTLVFQLNPD